MGTSTSRGPLLSPMRETDLLGRYEIVREVGRGGMATVYMARQRDLDRTVALKELKQLPRGEQSRVRPTLHTRGAPGRTAQPP